MKTVHGLINKLIIEITFMIVLCIISFLVFNIHKLDTVYDKVTFTDIDVLANENDIGINEFTNNAQFILKVTNDSNTNEDYKVLLTSKEDLSAIEDYLKIKINDKEYILKDLKVANNYFLIDKGNMKATEKEIDLFLAIDEENQEVLNNYISLEFVNDLTI